jgi:hypothetical protein
MSHKIVCLGGTGQMVLHYYLQLYLLGLIHEPFEAVVLDTDEIIEGIRAIERFLGILQYGNSPSIALGASIPTLSCHRAANPEGGKAIERLTSTGDREVVQAHPVRAFFDSETLAQSLRVGLFARPALSSVISLGRPAQQALNPSAGSTVVVVGSVIGGTGGGLMAPVIDEIRWRAQNSGVNVSVRAVVFGKYFTPDPGLIDKDESRFDSNEMLVLRSLHEALEGLDKFYIVRSSGERSDFRRRPQQEKEGIHLPWPVHESSYHPFWEGVQALEYLLRDTTAQNFERFEDREVESFPAPVALGRATLKLRQSLQVANRLVNKSVVLRMLHEPWLSAVWGEGLTNICSHFWRVAAKVEGGEERVKKFPRKLQRALDLAWDGRQGEPGLRDIFPPVEAVHRVRPQAVTRIPWPQTTDTSRSTPLFDSMETTARRAAATLLFWSLREGK